MASLEDAFSSHILPGDISNNVQESPVGVLIGRVVNATYYIYKDKTGDYYSLQNGKKIVLRITKADHGTEIEVPFIGYRYKVHIFDAVKEFKCN